MDAVVRSSNPATGEPGGANGGFGICENGT
jgi:hypothetical protein